MPEHVKQSHASQMSQIIPLPSSFIHTLQLLHCSFPSSSFSAVPPTLDLALGGILAFLLYFPHYSVISQMQTNIYLDLFTERFGNNGVVFVILLYL